MYELRERIRGVMYDRTVIYDVYVVRRALLRYR